MPMLPTCFSIEHMHLWNYILLYLALISTDLSWSNGQIVQATSHILCIMHVIAWEIIHGHYTLRHFDSGASWLLILCLFPLGIIGSINPDSLMRLSCPLMLYLIDIDCDNLHKTLGEEKRYCSIKRRNLKYMIVLWWKFRYICRNI